MAHRRERNIARFVDGKRASFFSVSSHVQRSSPDTLRLGCSSGTGYTSVSILEHTPNTGDGVKSRLLSVDRTNGGGCGGGLVAPFDPKPGTCRLLFEDDDILGVSIRRHVCATDVVAMTIYIHTAPIARETRRYYQTLSTSPKNPGGTENPRSTILRSTTTTRSPPCNQSMNQSTNQRITDQCVFL